MFTVKSLANSIEFGGGIAEKVYLASGGAASELNTLDPLAMAAYGDFVVDYIHVSECGVELVLKQDFVKAGA